MTRLVIRKSGGANIVSIPRAVLKALDLHVDSAVELTLEDNRIILTPLDEQQLSLQDLLDGSPQKRLAQTEEDSEWLGSRSVGKEDDL